MAQSLAESIMESNLTFFTMVIKITSGKILWLTMIKNLSECMHHAHIFVDHRNQVIAFESQDNIVSTKIGPLRPWPCQGPSIQYLACSAACNHHGTFLGLPWLTKRYVLHSSNHQSPRYLPSLYTHTHPALLCPPTNRHQLSCRILFNRYSSHRKTRRARGRTIS